MGAAAGFGCAKAAGAAGRRRSDSRRIESIFEERRGVRIATSPLRRLGLKIS
jgi:hypothetical protein